MSGDDKGHVPPGFDWVDDEREDEPLAEADALQSEASASACEVDLHQRDAPAHDAEFSILEEIQETFKPTKTVLVESPDDGMPIPADERDRGDLAVAPPFTVDTVVCIEDERVFVELFDTELCDRGWQRVPNFKSGLTHVPDLFMPKGIHRWERQGDMDVRTRYDGDGVARERRQFEPSQVKRKWGVLIAITGRAWIPVRPIRERCQFYKRMDMANDDIPDAEEFGHHVLFRNCSARRSVGGALMTLRDQAVYACEHRQPPDPSSTDKWLDGPDRERLASRRHLDMVPPFNLTG